MSTAALMELGATGDQDNNFIGNPEITFFKEETKRYTNFSQFCIETPFNKYNVADVPRSCNLVKDFCLCFTSNCKMNQNEIFNKIKSVYLEIGGQNIVQFSVYCLYIHLFMKNEEINTVPVYNEEGYIVYKYNIPINFTHFYIPLIALQYHNVKVRLKIQEIKEIPFNLIKKHPESKELDVLFQRLPRELIIKIYKYVIQFQNVFQTKIKMKLQTKCTFLDIEERRKFVQESHEFLTEDHQFTGTFKKEEGQTEFSTRLNFTHCVKYFAVFVSKSENEIDLSHNIDPIVKMRTVLNRHNGDYKDPLLLRITEPKKLIGKELPMGIYLISYALKPQEYQPSGVLNFSRIYNATLEIIFPPNSPEYYVSVTACSYNQLRVMNGMGGLFYAQ